MSKLPVPILFCLDLTGDLGLDGDEVYVCVTTKAYFEEHGCLDDCFRGAMDSNGENLSEVDPAAIHVMPRGFANSMEAVFEFYAPKGTSLEDAQKLAVKTLIDAGFEHSPEMHAYINE